VIRVAFKTLLKKKVGNLYLQLHFRIGPTIILVLH